jgi:hypothetical protein
MEVYSIACQKGDKKQTNQVKMLSREKSKEEETSRRLLQTLTLLQITLAALPKEHRDDVAYGAHLPWRAVPGSVGTVYVNAPDKGLP